MEAPTSDRSSLPLQVLIHYGRPYAILFIILNILLIIYKGTVFPWPRNEPGRVFSETLMLCTYLIIETIRLIIGSSGNKLQNYKRMLGFFFLSCGQIIVHLFFLSWQMYIMRLDIILNVIAIIILSIQLLLAFASSCLFYQNKIIH